MTTGGDAEPKLTYAEIEFLSGDCRIDIVPNFSLDEAHLVSCVSPLFTTFLNVQRN